MLNLLIHEVPKSGERRRGNRTLGNRSLRNTYLEAIKFLFPWNCSVSIIMRLQRQNPINAFLASIYNRFFIEAHAQQLTKNPMNSKNYPTKTADTREN